MVSVITNKDLREVFCEVFPHDVAKDKILNEGDDILRCMSVINQDKDNCRTIFKNFQKIDLSKPILSIKEDIQRKTTYLFKEHAFEGLMFGTFFESLFEEIKESNKEHMYKNVQLEFLRPDNTNDRHPLLMDFIKFQYDLPLNNIEEIEEDRSISFLALLKKDEGRYCKQIFFMGSFYKTSEGSFIVTMIQYRYALYIVKEEPFFLILFSENAGDGNFRHYFCDYLEETLDVVYLSTKDIYLDETTLRNTSLKFNIYSVGKNIETNTFDVENIVKKYKDRRVLKSLSQYFEETCKDKADKNFELKLNEEDINPYLGSNFAIDYYRQKYVKFKREEYSNSDDDFGQEYTRLVLKKLNKNISLDEFNDIFEVNNDGTLKRLIVLMDTKKLYSFYESPDDCGKSWYMLEQLKRLLPQIKFDNSHPRKRKFDASASVSYSASSEKTGVTNATTPKKLKKFKETYVMNNLESDEDLVITNSEEEESMKEIDPNTPEIVKDEAKKKKKKSSVTFKKKVGRPKKNECNDEDMDSFMGTSSTTVKKKVGRPKKNECNDEDMDSFMGTIVHSEELMKGMDPNTPETVKDEAKKKTDKLSSTVKKKVGRPRKNE